MHRFRSAALAAVALMAATAARAQMEHPAGMSHQQIVEAAMAGGPASVSHDATIGWIDSTGTFHQMQAGTNGWTCFITRPDPIAGPVCADANGLAFMTAMFKGQPAPPAMSAPGVMYMAQGGSHYEDAAGNVLMEHDLHHSPASRRVMEPPHWMLAWHDVATSGLPTKENAAGVYILFAGTPYAHLMIYQDPAKLTAPMTR